MPLSLSTFFGVLDLTFHPFGIKQLELGILNIFLGLLKDIKKDPPSSPFAQ